MTPAQTTLARRALGLPNKQNRSFRRHFVCSASHSDHGDWMAMVEGGFATRRDGASVPFGGDDLFHVTAAGAGLALEPGERLDAEDFPGACPINLTCTGEDA